MRLDIGSVIGKVWGTTQALHEGETTELQYLEVKKGFRCSNHRHPLRNNLFFVVSGKVRITVKKDGLEDTVILGPGQFTTVRRNLWHRFEVLKASKLIEFYWVDLHDADIERQDSGGPLKPNPSTPAGRKGRKQSQ